jgi:Ni,Fe-hydrogenase maturation factor
MKVYVFGNEDYKGDNRAFDVIKKFEHTLKDIEFVKVKPNEDVPFIDEEFVVILDAIEGINEVTEVKDNDLDKLVMSPRSSAHDYDLGFQIKYLKKLGKLGKVIIVGLPMSRKIDYLRIQSIFKKLVAQEMQGS